MSSSTKTRKRINMNTKPKSLDIRIEQLMARLADQKAVEREKVRKKKQREAFLVGAWIQNNRPDEVVNIMKMINAKDY